MTAAVEYLCIREGEPLPSIDAYSPFKCVVIIQTAPSNEWQHLVSRWLVDSGCLYMMAWGPSCSSWDDSVDYANLEDFEWKDIPDDRFVMTTWHDKEPLVEALGFAKFAAEHPNVELTRCLLIDIGTNSRREEILAEYAGAWVD